MTRTKRRRVVSLTQTDKKVASREEKTQRMRQLEKDVDSYKDIYVFRYDNSRNELFKQLRAQLQDTSKIVIGGNKIISLTFGRDKATEYAENLHLLADKLKGQVGLLFTNEPAGEFREFFRTFGVPDFARSGNIATERVVLPKGPQAELFQPSQQATLTKLGLPVELKKGVIIVTSDFVVCNEGDVLTPERAKILEFMGIKMAEFRIHLLACWSRGGAFEEL
ncbi:mRNA turnover protein 4-like [Porphyridium purpureum]|uniref:Ribosome assembly factor mrt4 n=1 Tax=Porphyridium purpureum TaxID=35688 RepID=A0A5J4YS71_PORPP|nr:mRNA turnover protein 4-like [Porphyridium purpureum]|eukprot:POR4116..scf236_6